MRLETTRSSHCRTYSRVDHESTPDRPAVVVVITLDVEADDEWRSSVSPPEYRGIRALPRLQDLCDEYRVQPTYLVTHDVASNRDCAILLNELAADGRCEIGAHMHPWRTPPFFPDLDCDTGYRPYLYDYPEAIQAQKMASLTHCIEDTFQRPITSHRAGRWGIDAYGLDLLEAHGYLVDTSVLPLADNRELKGYPGGAEGPDFRSVLLAPYRPSVESVGLRGTRQLLEIPVSVGAVGLGLGSASRLNTVRRLRRWGLAGKTAMKVLRRLRVLRAITMNPARHAVWELVALARQLLTENAPVLNMAFHSSELIADASPAVVTQADLDRVWTGIERVLAISSSSRTVSAGLSATAMGLMRHERPSERRIAEDQSGGAVTDARCSPIDR